MDNYTKSIVRDNFTSTTTEAHADLSRGMESVLRSIDTAREPECIDLVKLKLTKGDMVKGGIEVC
jgi:hypothetical protein